MGDGRWGQSDLAGNVGEWVLDWYATYTNPCSNCVNLTVASGRVLRGGTFFDVASTLLAAVRNIYTPASRLYNIGARCLRIP
jgi:formylglycine-generating enzyme required for sulfatase activity